MFFFFWCSALPFLPTSGHMSCLLKRSSIQNNLGFWPWVNNSISDRLKKKGNFMPKALCSIGVHCQRMLKKFAWNNDTQVTERRYTRSSLTILPLVPYNWSYILNNLRNAPLVCWRCGCDFDLHGKCFWTFCFCFICVKHELSARAANPQRILLTRLAKRKRTKKTSMESQVTFETNEQENYNIM